MDIVRTFLLRALPVLLALAALTAHAEPGSSAARNSNGAAQAEPLKIYAFRPHNRLFWSRFSTYLEAAADDLGVELTIIDAGNRPETMIEQAQTAVEERPDAIIFTDFDGNGEQMVRIAERAQIPIFLVNTRQTIIAPVGSSPTTCSTQLGARASNNHASWRSAATAADCRSTAGCVP